LLAQEVGERLVKVCDEVAGELLELDVEVVLGGVHGGRSLVVEVSEVQSGVA
jgi:hypothetical protein